MKRASLQRVISTFVLRTSAARNHFDFKVALAAYPCSGGDTPPQHDGNASVGFTLSMDYSLSPFFSVLFVRHGHPWKCPQQHPIVCIVF